MRSLNKSYTCIVASKSEKTVDSLSSMLIQNGYTKVLVADSASRIRSIVAEREVDMIIVNTPLVDDFGTNLAIDMAEKNLGVVLLVKREIVDQVSYKMEPYGAVTLGKPLIKSEFVQSLNVISAMLQKIKLLDRQKKTLEHHVKEMKLITRAKCLLIEQLAMTEEEAHRYIEKTAMDTSRKRVHIAEDIISTYEN